MLTTPFSTASGVPFRLNGRYRVQSRAISEYGTLEGDLIVSAPEVLSAEIINRYLRSHPQWDRRSTVSLRAATVKSRTGVFERHGDALYYRSNFAEVSSSPSIDHDLLDVTKLRDLYHRRLPFLRNVFTSQTFQWLDSLLHVVEPCAINEYMCHEGGHRLGYSVDEKMSSNFFRWGGKLRWPLIYLEEYRADVNSWDIALKNRPPDQAILIVFYSMMHRFGLAAENLRLALPGAGYVPFLHFADLVGSGFLQLTVENGKKKLAVQSYEVEVILPCIKQIAQSLSIAVNEKELTSRENDASAEALLEYGHPRLSDTRLLQAFADVFGMNSEIAAFSYQQKVHRPV